MPPVQVRSERRSDWFIWLNPDPVWVHANAAVPGLQYASANDRIITCTFHLSHRPVMPPEVAMQVEGIIAGRGGGTRAFDMDVKLAQKGIKLRPYQSADLPFLTARRGALLAYEMRLGKQQSVDAKVLTPRGWVPIGTLRPGDAVIGSTGSAVMVRGVFPQGVKPSYRVTFSDGSSVEAGPEHLWTVAYRAGGLRWQSLTLTTEQLRLRPTIEVNWSGRQQFKLDLAKTVLYLPMLSAPVEFAPVDPLPLPAYLIGQLIANGGLAHGTPCLTCHVDDWAEIRVRLSRDATDLAEPEVFGRACRVRVRGITAQIRALGLDKLSKDKRIPDVYLRAAVLDRSALLQGLMDGAGSISRKDNRVVYHTVSRDLAEDVRELVEGLGGIATIRTYDRRSEAKPIEYQVRVRLPLSTLPFSTSRKACCYAPGSHAVPRRTVRSVEYVRNVESVCISVDAFDALYATEHCILTHNTLTACAAHDPSDGMLVVVGPLASRDVWRNTIELVHGDGPRILQGRSNIEPVPGYPAYFVHYDVLDAWTKFFCNERIGTLVLDEVHMLQNRKAKRVSAVSVLAPRSTKIIGLSGTPVWNRPDSLYALLHMISPGAWGAHFPFAQRYCGAVPGAHGWTYDGISNDDELQARLAEIAIRRTWKDVAPELPPTTRVVEPVDVTAAQQTLIESAAMQVQLARGTSNVAGYLATLRRLLAEVKIKPAVEMTSQAIRDGHKVVLWTWHNNVSDKIEKLLRERGAQEGFEVCRLRSQDSANKREANVSAFHAAKAGVIIASIAVGGVAIDLSCADYAIFAEVDWIPAMVYQAERRTFSPARPDAIVYLMSDTVTETRLMESLAVKDGLASRAGFGLGDIMGEVFSGNTAPGHSVDWSSVEEVMRAVGIGKEG